MKRFGEFHDEQAVNEFREFLVAEAQTSPELLNEILGLWNGGNSAQGRGSWTPPPLPKQTPRPIPKVQVRDPNALPYANEIDTSDRSSKAMGQKIDLFLNNVIKFGQKGKNAPQVQQLVNNFRQQWSQFKSQASRLLSPDKYGFTPASTFR